MCFYSLVLFALMRKNHFFFDFSSVAFKHTLCQKKLHFFDGTYFIAEFLQCMLHFFNEFVIVVCILCSFLNLWREMLYSCEFSIELFNPCVNIFLEILKLF